jgi:pyrroloquinoline quinone biosynthesis protein E
MRTVFLMTTTRCNNRCGFCFNRRQPGLDRPADLAADALPGYADALAPLGFTHWVVTGGEPLVHPEIDRILAVLADRGDLVEIITNGVLLADDRARAIGAILPGTVILSLNDVHNARRDAEAFGPETRARLARLCRLLPGKLAVIFVFTRDTADLIADAVAACAEAGAPLIVQPACAPPNDPERAAFDPLTLPPARWARAIAAMTPWARRAGTMGYLGLLQGLYNGTGPRPTACGMGDGACVVDADGAVFPCFHRRDLPAGRLGVDPPDRIGARLAEAHRLLRGAPCFGEHCVTLFVG